MASAGSEKDAAAAPTGTAVWRNPSARPRSARGNQPNTARPLPLVAAAANTPAANMPASSEARPSASATRASAAPPTAGPMASTSRSPTRSASTPQAYTVATVPRPKAVNTAVTSTRLSPKAAWSAGPSAGRPPWTAASAAVEAAPRARMAQR